MGGRYLSDKAAAAGTSKHRSGSTARRTARHNLQHKLDAEAERLNVASAVLEAEKLAWGKQQQESGVVLDPLTKARAAGAAIEDTAARKRHARLLGNAERFVSQLAAVPHAGRHVAQRMTGAAAGLVCDTKKVTADAALRFRQEQRQQRRGAQSAARARDWEENHLANQGAQTKWRKLSRKHTVAKRKNRREQAERQNKGRWPRSPARNMACTDPQTSRPTGTARADPRSASRTPSDRTPGLSPSTAPKRT